MVSGAEETSNPTETSGLGLRSPESCIYVGKQSNCDSGAKPLKLTIMEKYFKLFDRQIGSYSATGYNARGVDELKKEFMSFISNDTDEDDISIIEAMNENDFLSHLEASEYTVESSENEFEELDY